MNEPLTRLTAALADRYRIERELGTGGMATVYLAHDVRHERPVALKVLRPELAAIIGAERFLAEIKTTAHLQHPHILGLIDSGEVNGTAFYVMPFVRGESLRDRLNREQQLPIADAVRIATQIAGALDYAHRQGIIHRDIKPENVLLHDEQALVADFGIALALSRPSEQKRMTETGLSLGTPQYMSPEQAAGDRNLDARTDVYALGSVLYEMLAGEPPFTGPNAHAVISKVISMEPQPVSALRRSVPRNVAGATMVALSKVPADRFPSAASFAAALADGRYTAPQGAPTRAVSSGPTVGLGALAAVVAVTVLAVLAAWGWLRPAPEIAGIVARFQITIPDSIAPGGAGFVLSHDGRRILLGTAAGGFERPIDSLGIRRIGARIGGGRDVSPDGREVLAPGRGSISFEPAGGGPARSIRSGGRAGGYIWDVNGFVYWSFANDSIRAIARATSRSDSLEIVAPLDSVAQPAGIAVMPDGRSLVVAFENDGDPSLRAWDASSGSWRTLRPGGLLVHFVPPGFLVYSSGSSVLAAPFDPRRLEFTAEPVRIAETSGGTIDRLSVRGGVLVYSAPDPTGTTGLTLRARDGAPRVTPNTIDTLVFSQFAVSPDGRRIAVTGAPRGGRGGQQSERLYVYPLPIGPMQRVQASERELAPAWIPPGNQLSFVRMTRDSTFLLRRNWDDGSGATSTVLAASTGDGGGRVTSAAWLPSGREAVLAVTQRPDGNTGRGAGEAGGRGGGRGGRRGGGGGGGGGPPTDLMLYSIANPASLEPVVQTESSEGSPSLSPDGRLLAYQSDESGQNEVYIIRLDGSAKRQVSLTGGQQPRWSPGGRQLYFRLVDTLFSARITTSPELEVGAIERVFSGALLGGYAVLPGDTLFVTRRSDPTPPPLNVITNVDLLLARLFKSQQN